MPLAPPKPTARATVYSIKPSSSSVTGSPPLYTAIRYVRKSGSDANGGTSPADAWLTINKALTTAAPGTLIYVGAGVYREVSTVTITPTAGSPVSLIGDVDGLFTGDVGMVQWTSFVTNDRILPASPTLILNGKSNITFQNIFLINGGNLQLCDSTVAGSQNITFVDCAFQMTGVGTVTYLFNHVTVPGTPSNILFDRCIFNGSQGECIRIQGIRSPANDYDVNVLARNCKFYGNTNRLTLFSGGAGSGKAGGLRAQNCTSFNGSAFLTAFDAGCSTSIPCTAYGCLILNFPGATIFSANASGQIVEDYNVIWSSTPRTNTPAGPHSIATNAISNLYHFGQEIIWGDIIRHFGEPMASSPFNTFGALDTSAGLLDRRKGPRPSSASRWAVGALQRGNNMGKETITINTGLNAISVTGDGFEDFELEVDAGPLTISVYCDYDGSYTGPLPRLAILANGEVGVGYTEVNFSGTSSSAFSSASITVNPTASGFITVRVISGDTSGVSKVAFDTFSVA